MKPLLSLTIIFGCLFAGEFVSYVSGITFPGSIIGLLLLTFLLKIKAVKLDWVEQAGNFLIKYMSFFFIPPGVGLISYFDIIRAQWLPIVVSCVLSTLLVLAATAFTYKFLYRK